MHAAARDNVAFCCGEYREVRDVLLAKKFTIQVLFAPYAKNSFGRLWRQFKNRNTSAISGSSSQLLRSGHLRNVQRWTDTIGRICKAEETLNCPRR